MLKNMKSIYKFRNRILISCFIFYSMFCGFNSIFSTNFPLANDINNVYYEQSNLLGNLNWTPIEETINFSLSNNNFYLENQPSQIIEYNLLSKTEKLKEMNENTINQLSQKTIPPYTGILKEDYEDEYRSNLNNPQISYPFENDRVKITNTSSFPWRTLCKLFITADDDTEFIGSAAIIDEFHILTVGHCIFIHDHGGWVSELEVIPGMAYTYEPFGHAYATYIRTYTDWTQDAMYQHDWAVVTLDRSLGNFTGWMGRKTEDPSSANYTGILHTAGYPGDLDNGFYMYYDSDYGNRTDEYNHWFWMDSAGGQSGSPVWQYDGENRYILSILAYEYENGADANFGTRLNQNKFDDITSWLLADSLFPPDDLPDLLDRGFSSGISTSTVTSGKTIFSIYSDIKNHGTEAASSFTVNFYASEDHSITTADFLIGNTSINNLAPFGSTPTNWSGIFPSSIPTGNYYIGWIIDANNDIEEIDENNNIISDSRFQIAVTSKKSPNLLIPILITIPIVLVGLVILIVIIKKRVHKRAEVPIDHDFPVN